MSNTNNNLQTQTSNALHNAIMEAGGEDRPLILAPVAKGSSETTTEWYMENYKNVSQDIQDQQNAKAEAVQIVLLGIDNYIYSTDDACPNACETWKAIKRLKHGESINVQDLKTNLYCEFRKFTSQDGESLKSYYSRNKGKEIVNSPPPTYDQEPNMVTEDDALLKENRIDKLMALISLSFKKIYKPTNNNLRTSSNTSRANQDNTLRINREQADWRDDTDDEPNNQEFEAHYMYMAQIQEVTPDAADNSRPIFDTEPLNKRNKVILTSLLIHYRKSTNRETVDQDDDLARECEIEDFKTNNKSLESSNNHFKEANNELSKTNQFDFKTLRKFQAELDRYRDVNYASKVAIDCAKAKGDLITVAAESTNQKLRSTIRKQDKQISKTCRWWYCKITPPGYKWKPKSRTVSVEPNVSMHLGTKSRTTTILEPRTLRKSTISNTPSSSNSFAVRRDNSIRYRLWVLKAHDGKSQAFK
ncbi:hypothetical protein Tco_0743002 [Tanacetum coccineum]